MRSKLLPSRWAVLQLPRAFLSRLLPLDLAFVSRTQRSAAFVTIRLMPLLHRRHSMPAVPTRGTVSEGNSRAPSRQASPDRSAEHSPELRPGLRHGHGSHASLNKLPQTLYKLPEKAFKTSEAWSKDHLDPKRYYRESNAYRNHKSLAASDSQPGTPRADTPTNDYFGDKTKRRKRDKKRQDEIFITMHVAAILQRQDFVLRLARALMMFGKHCERRYVFRLT